MTDKSKETLSLATAENGDVTISKKRHGLCMEAAYEIDAIAYMLAVAVERTDGDALCASFRVRCMASRLRELSSALMQGLGDALAPLGGVDGLTNLVLMTDDSNSVIACNET